MRTSLFCIAWLLASSALPGSGQEVEDLKQIYGVYTTARQQVIADHDKQLSALRSKHLEPLKKRRAGLLKQGDLDAILDLENLRRRIAGKPSDPLLNNSPRFHSEHGAFQQQQQALQAEQAAAEAELREAYAAALEEQVSALTKAAKIDEAVELRIIAKSVGNHPLDKALPFKLPGFLQPKNPDTPALTDAEPAAGKLDRNAKNIPGTVPPFLKKHVLLYLSLDQMPPSDQFHGDGPEKVPCTIHGKPRFIDGKRGKAIQLSEKKDHISVKPFVLGNEITLAAWVRYDRRESWGHILKMSDLNKGGELAIFCGSQGENLMTTMSGRGDHRTHLSATATCDLKKWMYIVSTCDRSGNVRLYKNARLISSGRHGFPISSHPREFVQIGRDLDASGVQVHHGVYGLIDEVLVLNRALAPNEVGELYNWFGGE